MAKKNIFDAAFEQTFVHQPAESRPQPQKPNNFSIILTYGRCRCVLTLPNFDVRRTLNFLFEFAKSCGIPRIYRKDPNGFIPAQYDNFLLSIIKPLNDFYHKYTELYGEE